MIKKKNHPQIEDIEIADVLHALGDPVRLAVVRKLYESKTPLTCQQAVDGIPNLPVASRSRCFEMLRQGGVLKSEPIGRECYNSLRLKELNKKFPNLIKTILK